MAQNFSIGTSERSTNFTGSRQERTRCNTFPYYNCLRQIQPKVDQIIDIGWFSDVIKLIRVTAFVIKFINKLKNRTPENRKGEMEDLTTTELKDAENLWIQLVQASSFTDELSFLTQKDSKSTPPIHVPQLGLFFDDDGIIRCKGRITNASLSLLQEPRYFCLPNTPSPISLLGIFTI